MAGAGGRAVHVCALLALVFLSDFLSVRQSGPSGAFSKQMLGTTDSDGAREAATGTGVGRGGGGHPPPSAATLTASPPRDAAPSSSAIPSAPGFNKGPEPDPSAAAPVGWNGNRANNRSFVSGLASDAAPEKRPASVSIPRAVRCPFFHSVGRGDTCSLLYVKFFYRSPALFARMNGGVPCGVGGRLFPGSKVCIPPPSSRICAWGTFELAAGDTCASVVARYFRGRASLFNSANAPLVCSDPNVFVQGRPLCLPPPSRPPPGPPPKPQPPSPSPPSPPGI